MEVGDIIVGLALLGVAAWFWIGAGSIPDYSATSIGSGDFPRGLATLLGLFCAVMVGAAVLRLVRRQPDGHWITVARPVYVVIGAGLLLAFPALMEAFGYYPAMGVWLAAFLWIAGCRRPLEIVIYVVSFLAFTKIVFEIVLGTPIS